MGPLVLSLRTRQRLLGLSMRRKLSQARALLKFPLQMLIQSPCQLFSSWVVLSLPLLRFCVFIGAGKPQPLSRKTSWTWNFNHLALHLANRHFISRSCAWGHSFFPYFDISESLPMPFRMGGTLGPHVSTTDFFQHTNIHSCSIELFYKQTN